MIRKLKLLTLLTFTLSLIHPALAQTTTGSFPTGTIVDVTVQSSPDQSYALYLPENYSPQRPWPTILCLDPRARGKNAIERFVPGARKYGYIVVCSNNSRNGLNWQTISQIFSDFWKDAHERLSIDEKRTYAAGFSGGSRLATTFASRCRGCLAGVIANGAGFPGDIQPDAKSPFVYYGIVGVDDFNFAEMWELEKKLYGLGLVHHFETVNGGHEWASRESIADAIAWLTLQTMRSGVVEKDRTFLEEQFKLRSDKAEGFLIAKHFVDAHKAFLSIARDFKDLRDVSAAVDKAEALGKSAELRRERKTEEQLNQRQLSEAGEIRMFWLKPLDPDENRSYRSEARVKLAEWRKKKEAQADSPDRRLARRILSQLLIGSYESAQASLNQKDYAQAVANYQLAREVEPTSANLAYEVARVYALKGDRKPALQTLEDAVSLGFKDLTRLKGEEAFTAISDDPRFQRLLAALSNH